MARRFRRRLRRPPRGQESRFKLLPGEVVLSVFDRLAEIEIPLDAGDFRLMDRRVVLAMRQLREKNRFMRGLSSWVGFKQVAVEYERAARFAGETKYPFGRCCGLRSMPLRASATCRCSLPRTLALPWLA